MRTWIDVASLTKAKNSKGRFAARAAAGLPFLLEEGDEVAFVPPQTDMPRRAIVAEVTAHGGADGNGAEVADIAFEGLDSPDVMRALVGSHCLIRRDAVDETVFHDAPGTWEGWAVVDDSLGEVGRVSGIVVNPAQTLLEVERADGAGMALVPVVDEIVHDVDVSARRVLVALPAGLLDL